MRPPSSAIASTGSRSATARRSRPAITSRRSPARALRSRVYVPIHGVPTDLTAAPGRTGRRAGAASTRRASASLYYTRAEIEDGALANKAAGARLGGRPDRALLPPDPGLGPGPLPGRKRDARSAMPTRTAANMSRSGACCASAAFFLRAAPTCRRSRRGCAPTRTRAATLMRENLSLHLLPRADRAGAARGAQRSRHAARDRRGRPEVRSAGRAGLPRRSTGRRPTASGSRRTRAARSRARTASTPSGAHGTEATQIAGGMSANGVGADPGAEGRRQLVRARSALKKPSSGLGSPRPSGRCRASS